MRGEQTSRGKPGQGSSWYRYSPTSPPVALAPSPRGNPRARPALLHVDRPTDRSQHSLCDEFPRVPTSWAAVPRPSLSQHWVPTLPAHGHMCTVCLCQKGFPGGRNATVSTFLFPEKPNLGLPIGRLVNNCCLK